MTIIKGVLLGKTLSFEKNSANQGEAGETVLEISLTPEQNVNYYLEFLCPYQRKYLSAMLDIEDNTINYTIPSCVFLVAGELYAQIVGRSGGEIVFKSKKSASAKITVLPSVNGAEHSAEHTDFISKAESALALTQETLAEAAQATRLAEQKTTEMTALLADIAQKIQNSEFDGKNAYQYAIDGGYIGSEEEFERALGVIGDVLDEAPDEAKYARTRGTWVKIADVPAPNDSNIGNVLKVMEREGNAEYVLMPQDENTAIIDIDASELENFARQNPNSVFYGAGLSSVDTILNTVVGKISVRFIFQGNITLQIIEDKYKGIRYKRQKTEGSYAEAAVEPIIPLKIENISINPDSFTREQYYYTARINVKELCGYNISDNVVPMLILGESSRINAYEYDLKKEINLINGLLTIKATRQPLRPFFGDLVLLGVS